MQPSLLIHNPVAGRFPVEAQLDGAAAILRQAGWELIVERSRSNAHARQLAAQAVTEGFGSVLVAGGDGTVGQVAAVLAGSPVALGVIPTGTANVWAHELGMSRPSLLQRSAPTMAASRLVAGERRAVDIGLCNEHRFLLWTGLGLDGEIVNRLEPRKRWQKAIATAHYATFALARSFRWEGIEMQVRSGGEAWEGRYMVAIASNICSYAGGLLNLTPEAKVDDGLLDFWLLGGSSAADLLLRVAQILMGTHLSAPGVTHFKSAQVDIEADGPLPVQLDGEPAQLHSPVRFSLIPKSLQVIVPQGDPPAVFSSEV